VGNEAVKNNTYRDCLIVSERMAVRIAATISLLLGIVLIAINVYGEFQSIRRPGLGVDDHQNLRFVPEQVKTFEQSMDEISGLIQYSSKTLLAREANRIVHESLVHVDWKRVDPKEYRQLVPVWENYILYLVGRYSKLPQFERYHYASYKKSIARGIGICGDAAIVLTGVLNKYGVESRIVSFDGHVIVEYVNDEGEALLLDPDFGIELDFSLDKLLANPGLFRSYYHAAGYSERELNLLTDIFQRNYVLFDDAYHFMKKRFLFEYASYFFKWLLPITLIVIPFYGLKKWRA